MHSTLGVEAAAGKDGWLHYLVEFARPFRMPDFFMISGLFLANVIDRDWRTYLDRKVVHFFYFYLLWMTIQFVFKAPGIIAEGGVDGSRAALSAVADRSVRHAVVHLSAADLLHLREADEARAVAGDLAGRRRARNLACRNRLDGAGRIRRPLRLFLHRLYRRALHLRAHRARAEQAVARSRRPDGVGRVQRHHGASRLCARCRSIRSAWA